MLLPQPTSITIYKHTDTLTDPHLHNNYSKLLLTSTYFYLLLLLHTTTTATTTATTIANTTTNINSSTSTPTTITTYTRSTTTLSGVIRCYTSKSQKNITLPRTNGANFSTARLYARVRESSDSIYCACSGFHSELRTAHSVFHSHHITMCGRHARWSWDVFNGVYVGWRDAVVNDDYYYYYYYYYLL